MTNTLTNTVNWTAEAVSPMHEIGMPLVISPVHQIRKQPVELKYQLYMN